MDEPRNIRRVRLVLPDSFVTDLARARAAGRRITADLARMQATWEPHDWEDFS